MTAMYVVLPIALALAGTFVACFVWVVRSGQLDDVDTPPARMLFDDDADRAFPARTPLDSPTLRESLR